MDTEYKYQFSTYELQYIKVAMEEYIKRLAKIKDIAVVSSNSYVDDDIDVTLKIYERVRKALIRDL